MLEKVSRRQPVVAEVTARISVEFYDTQSPANLAAAGGWGGGGQCQMFFSPPRRDTGGRDIDTTPPEFVEPFIDSLFSKHIIRENKSSRCAVPK